MINHDVVFNKEKIKEEYVALNDVYTVKFEAQIFQQIIDQFPDIQEDVKKMISKRAHI